MGINERFDAVIIGAGMSGLAAGIRLAMFGKRVVILEKHQIPGGLNSYYRRGEYNLDVGLHAMTNFTKKGDRSSPLGKIFKQLRIPYEAFNLCEQGRSAIVMGNNSLSFSNDSSSFISEIKKNFKSDAESIETVINFIKSHDPFTPRPFKSAREYLRSQLLSEDLVDLLLFPVLFYGGPIENDMDLDQFVIMFRSVFFEGLARPSHGIRPLIDTLVKRYTEEGGVIKFNSKVESISRVESDLKLTLSSGEEILSEYVVSTAGLVETGELTDHASMDYSRETGNICFSEVVFILDRPYEKECDSSIVFYNDSNRINYKTPLDAPYSLDSFLICFPGNFKGEVNSKTTVKFSCLSNYEKWREMNRGEYIACKRELTNRALAILNRWIAGIEKQVLFSDVFTPLTVLRYTGHKNGAIYGAKTKLRDGLTPIPNLFICGTDQGLVGITGAMISGISIVNTNILAK